MYIEVHYSLSGDFVSDISLHFSSETRSTRLTGRPVGCLCRPTCYSGGSQNYMKRPVDYTSQSVGYFSKYM